MIHTSFWSDPYIQDLNPDEKLLYLYLLTNERTSICGIYEITEKTMAFDTGIELKNIKQTVDRLIQAGKLRRYENWVYLLNFSKHQKSNPSIEQGIERAIKELPAGVFDRLGTDCIQYGLLKPKLELELEPKLELEVSTPAQKMKKFINSISEKNNEYFDLIEILKKKGILEKSIKEELKNFTLYWTEKNKSGDKERWEMEKTFEIGRRLARWFNNSGKFKNRNFKKFNVGFIS